MSGATNGGIGKPIKENFTDINLAQAVASGDVNAVLTSEMVTNCTNIKATEKNITDLSGIGVLTELEYLDLASNNI
ncbi:hypothetical protein AZF37_01015 [endosymbiont 'TC1' of Trimyema compressum]|nr:hypothetical protein AZF37_01015 [endosymbiont 'TC1' of Trimyema compressum]